MMNECRQAGYSQVQAGAAAQRLGRINRLWRERIKVKGRAFEQLKETRYGATASIVVLPVPIRGLESLGRQVDASLIACRANGDQG
jgi:hypothetical protein